MDWKLNENMVDNKVDAKVDTDDDNDVGFRIVSVIVI